MNRHVLSFLEDHKDKLTGRILEVGSLNVNGSARDVIPVTIGIDMRKGKGVDLVLDVQNLKFQFPDESFDTVISCDCLEHVEDWQSFVKNTWDVTKKGGYLCITMASPNKGFHGYPNDYHRFTKDQIKEIYPNAEVFDLGRISIGWIVKKQGHLNLNVEPSCPKK